MSELFNIILQSFIVYHYVSHKFLLLYVFQSPLPKWWWGSQELEVKTTNLTTCTISASTDFFFFLF